MYAHIGRKLHVLKHITKISIKSLKLTPIPKHLNTNLLGLLNNWDKFVVLFFFFFYKEKEKDYNLRLSHTKKEKNMATRELNNKFNIVLMKGPLSWPILCDLSDTVYI